MSARTITLLLAILGMMGTVATTLTGPDSFVHLSPAQAVVLSALGAGVYALTRALQKIKAGTPFGKLLATSEAKGAFIVYLASLITAVSGLVPPQYSVMASAIATMLVGVGRQLQKSSPPPSGDGSGFPKGGSGPLAAAIVLIGILTLWSAAKVHAETMDGGVGSDTRVVEVAGDGVKVIASSGSVAPAPVKAPTVAPVTPPAAEAPSLEVKLIPKLTPPMWSWGPSVAAAVGAINLHDGSDNVGPNAVPLGACIGLTYLPIDAGIDGCFNFVLTNKGAPNLYFPSVMLHLQKYFQAGVGLLARQNSDSNGLYYNLLILLGGRYGFAGG